MSKICGSSRKEEWKKGICGLVGHFEEIWSRQPEDDFGNQGRKNVDINKKNKDVVSYQDRIRGNNIKNEIGKRKKRIKMENIEIRGMMEVK